VALVVSFAIAGVASRLYHGQQASMARQWYQRGNAELAAGHATTAVDDFSNALVYSRDNDLFELHLAQAFIAAGRPPEARAHLEEIWERTPGSGIVNLELARLAAQRGDSSEAVRYYNNAIYGVWEGEAEQQERRRDAEFELYKFLMKQGQGAQAEAELVAIAAGLPADPALHIQVGKLMLGNSDFAHALSEFRTALEVGRAQPEALEGAGEASFQLGDYPTAVRYLEQAIRNKTSKPTARQLLEISQAVLNLDPFDSRLGASERARRASRSLALAIARLDSCTGRNIQDRTATLPADLQNLYSQARKMQAQGSINSLQRHPEEIGPLMDLVANLETAAVKSCGESSEAADRALLLIARQRGGTLP
jgi:tetratricopeptide (TPR) repeat protein